MISHVSRKGATHFQNKEESIYPKKVDQKKEKRESKKDERRQKRYKLSPQKKHHAIMYQEVIEQTDDDKLVVKQYSAGRDSLSHIDVKV